MTERNTRQREAIQGAFTTAGRPLSPQEAHEQARADVPRLGIATVYRTIARLVADGVLIVVELPGAPPRYELAGLAHHHHFHCELCQRVFDLPGCPGNMERLIPAGFRLERHELVLYGQCPQCAG
jgi:Fur family ferric uptake transcriptional regulator